MIKKITISLPEIRFKKILEKYLTQLKNSNIIKDFILQSQVPISLIYDQNESENIKIKRYIDFLIIIFYPDNSSIKTFIEFDGESFHRYNENNKNIYINFLKDIIVNNLFLFEKKRKARLIRVKYKSVFYVRKSRKLHIKKESFDKIISLILDKE